MQITRSIVKKSFFIAVILLTTSLNAEIKNSGFALSAALIGMSMDYREYDNGIIQDSEKSQSNEIMGSDINLVYTTVLENENYMNFATSLSCVFGQTEYIGSFINSNLGYGSVVSQSDNILVDLAMQFTYMYQINDNFALGYGLGVGYRLWRRELSASQIEVYKWFSLRPALVSEYSMGDFVLGMQVEYQYGISPEMTILADEKNPDTTLNLGSADIFTLSIPLKYNINNSISLFTEYEYEYQTITRSNTTSYIINNVTEQIYEPGSRAYNQYLKFGAIFKF